MFAQPGKLFPFIFGNKRCGIHRKVQHTLQPSGHIKWCDLFFDANGLFQVLDFCWYFCLLNNSTIFKRWSQRQSQSMSKGKCNRFSIRSNESGFQQEKKNPDTEDSVKKSRNVCLRKVFSVIVTFTTVHSMIAWPSTQIAVSQNIKRNVKRIHNS